MLGRGPSSVGRRDCWHLCQPQGPAGVDGALHGTLLSRAPGHSPRQTVSGLMKHTWKSQVTERAL